MASIPACDVFECDDVAVGSRRRRHAMERYRKVRKLGEGAHGVVSLYEYLGHHEEPTAVPTKRQKHVQEEEPRDMASIPQYVAIKKIRNVDLSFGISQDAIRELRLLQELGDHPNVMTIRDVFSKKESLYLVLDYMHTDLEHIIKDAGLFLKPADIKQYMLMLLSGVKHCHDNFVLHRDLKPSNCLLSETKHLKLADFGLAKQFGSPGRSLSPQACTLWYRAPELLFGATHYGPQADMWSCGTIFAELLIRGPLFPGSSEIDQLQKIFALLGSPTPETWPGVDALPHYVRFEEWQTTPLESILPGVTADAIDLLHQLLYCCPSKRISAYDALQHPYFTAEPFPTPVDKLEFTQH